MIDSTQRAAYHEAGHAVVNVVLGVRFERVSMQLKQLVMGDGTEITYTDGIVELQGRRKARECQRTQGLLDLAWAVSAMAGEAAEAIHVGEFDDECDRAAGSDRIHVIEVVRESIVRKCDGGEHLLAGLLNGCSAEAVRIVKRHWLAIAEVARQLGTLGMLGFGEVARIVATTPTAETSE